MENVPPAWQYTPYTIPLVLTAAAALGLSVYVWQRRAAPGAMAYAILLWAASEWTLCYALRLASTGLAAKVFWHNAAYLGIEAVPVLWLIFSLQYTGRDAFLWPRWALALAIVPVATTAVIWTNDAHGLFRETVTLDSTGDFIALVVTDGPWFWVGAAYAYGLLLTGTLPLVALIFRSPFLYRWQAILVVLGMGAPWMGNAVYIFGLSPWPHLDLTPFGFIPGALAAGWGLFRFRFLRVVPVARDRIFEDMADGVIVVDPQGLVIDVNPAAQAILGIDSGSPMGRLADEVLAGFINAAWGQEEISEARHEITRGRGDTGRTYEVRVSGLHRRSGRPEGTLVVLHDISDRKRSEEEMVRAQRLSAVGELSVGISHNLNNILTGILGPAEILSDIADNDDIRQQSQLISASAIRARDLVQRLGDAARRREDPELAPVSVQQAVDEAVDAARPRWKDEAEARGVKVEIAVEIGDVPPIAGTPSGLHDVLLNLLLNAVDAVAGGGQILIRARAVEECVELVVQDTGVGMHEQVRRRVFEPFFTTRMEVGTGLGLSTAHSTVTQWGGSIEVDSERGQGSTFTLRLPIWQGTREQESPPSVEVDAGVAPALASSRILVAEDEAVVQLMLVSVLEKAGHEVDVEGDGRAALDRVEPGRYQVAIIDLGMPGLPGDQVASAIKRRDPKVATILTTGWILDGDDPRLAAFDHCLQKPFSPKQAETAVARAVAICSGERS